MSRISCWYRNR